MSETHIARDILVGYWGMTLANYLATSAGSDIEFATGFARYMGPRRERHAAFFREVRLAIQLSFPIERVATEESPWTLAARGEFALADASNELSLHVGRLVTAEELGRGADSDGWFSAACCNAGVRLTGAVVGGAYLYPVSRVGATAAICATLQAMDGLLTPGRPCHAGFARSWGVWWENEIRASNREGSSDGFREWVLRAFTADSPWALEAGDGIGDA